MSGIPASIGAMFQEIVLWVISDCGDSWPTWLFRLEDLLLCEDVGSLVKSKITPDGLHLSARSHPYNYSSNLRCGILFSIGFTASQHITEHVFITCPTSLLPHSAAVSLIARAIAALLSCPCPSHLSFSHLAPSPFLLIDAETYWFLSQLLLTGLWLSLSLMLWAAPRFFQVNEGGSITLPIGF